LKIWFDFSTPPDPLFFRPIVHRVQSAGHSVWITARKFAETTAIAEQCGFTFQAVGEHGGRTVLGKGAAILLRAIRLANLARKQPIDLAVSFNSYAQGLAARFCGIPFVTCMDYEYQPANHLAFRLAQRIIVPRGFDLAALRKQGGRADKVVFFDGLKEHVTLADFQPDPAFPKVLAELGIEEDDILITMRTPGIWATYHRFENPLFDEAVTYLARLPKVKILLLPRYPFQADYYRGLHLNNLIVPPQVLDGLNLVYWSDMVISAGGSMNREAAVLGTPVWTIFAGKMAGVDQKMISDGIMKQINSPQDLQRVIPVKKSACPFRPVESEAVMQIVEAILTAKARISAKQSMLSHPSQGARK